MLLLLLLLLCGRDPWRSPIGYSHLVLISLVYYDVIVAGGGNWDRISWGGCVLITSAYQMTDVSLY